MFTFFWSKINFVPSFLQFECTLFLGRRQKNYNEDHFTHERS